MRRSHPKWQGFPKGQSCPVCKCEKKTYCQQFAPSSLHEAQISGPRKDTQAVMKSCPQLPQKQKRGLGPTTGMQIVGLGLLARKKLKPNSSGDPQIPPGCLKMRANPTVAQKLQGLSAVLESHPQEILRKTQRYVFGRANFSPPRWFDPHGCAICVALKICDSFSWKLRRTDDPDKT